MWLLSSRAREGSWRGKYIEQTAHAKVLGMGPECSHDRKDPSVCWS